MKLRNGLASLLRPEDSVLVLIDHQPYQLANLNSHEPQMVINNTVGLAKAAKAFGVPVILTTVVAARGGWLFPQISGHSLCFLESAFSSETALLQQLQSYFGAVQLSVEPLSLREISTAMIRHTRKAASEARP